MRTPARSCARTTCSASSRFDEYTPPAALLAAGAPATRSHRVPPSYGGVYAALLARERYPQGCLWPFGLLDFGVIFSAIFRILRYIARPRSPHQRLLCVGRRAGLFRDFLVASSTFCSPPRHPLLTQWPPRRHPAGLALLLVLGALLVGLGSLSVALHHRPRLLLLPPYPTPPSPPAPPCRSAAVVPLPPGGGLMGSSLQPCPLPSTRTTTSPCSCRMARHAVASHLSSRWRPTGVLRTPVSAVLPHLLRP